ncbi:Holliday junction branch migration protein RuvA [Patescibacteria group bacterium]|nr:Holliday junction branch migration protein RuvA [Patescibacteria group bacterium]MBU0879197.1 Holliday junction branch migration protein RuvA [Patescibacteria group bacterium]MBU0880219.1 Holliday junction branch migration protein RuvA [Patescibacteria group bacterium]MBU0897677.1 Holliday junction branch migration protein RuvA [Patescibacteria group bacterium]MBU1062970.1 Holliday junction branch migration protein RuvA [Patescibacteria group bacterium]
MIAFLSGKIKNKSNGYIILEVNNIGYKVFISQIFFADLDINQAVDLYTHQYIREDALDLYGLRSLDELEFFELLISISGIGPKSALGVLSIAGINDIKESIVAGDPTLLTKVSGIGRKIAERVVLELREKIRKTNFVEEKTGSISSSSGDEIDALLALGYSIIQARQALQAIDPKIKESGERIRQALRNLGR